MQNEPKRAGSPDPRSAVECGEAIAVEGVEFRVWMHESGTSAVAWFVDARKGERRVSMIARAGGGALTTTVPKEYEAAIQALGCQLWPSAQSRPSPSGLYRVAPARGALAG
jgi:hypothetical protein